MSNNQKQEIIKKVKRLDDIGQRFDVKLYCPHCHSRLLWYRIYNDLATALILEQSDCKHYYWDYLHCNPEAFDENDWWCRGERKYIESIKDRVMYIISNIQDYLVLIKEQ